MELRVEDNRVETRPTVPSLIEDVQIAARKPLPQKELTLGTFS
jgi:hypothetical protein